MIRKTVYFRTQEDLDKFNAIGNKAEWLHEHLSMPKFTKVQLSQEPVPQIKCPDCPFLTYSQGQLESHIDQFHANVPEPTLTPPEEIA